MPICGGGVGDGEDEVDDAPPPFAPPPDDDGDGSSESLGADEEAPNTLPLADNDEYPLAAWLRRDDDDEALITDDPIGNASLLSLAIDPPKEAPE